MFKKVKCRKSIRSETPQPEESNRKDEIVPEGRHGSCEENVEIKDIKCEEIIHKSSKKLSPSQLNKQKPKLVSSISNSTPVFKTSLLWKCSPLLILIGLVYTQLKENGNKKLCSFEMLKREYSKENDGIWQELQFGVESMLNNINEKPFVFLLAHHNTENSLGLIDKITQLSSKCSGKKLIPMKSEDFYSSSKDYGYAIEKYKSKIKEGDVFFIANLNNIPALAARALHAICDTYSPLKTNVVIFLTLTIQMGKEGNANSLAEETLTEIWGSDLDSSELDPLITRVTDQVIRLKS